MRRVLLPALAGLLLAPAAASAKVPTLPVSPATGGTKTVFTLTVPATIVRKMDDGAELVADVRHKKDRCTPPVIPKVSKRGDGSVRIRMKPSYMRPDQKRWCTGVHRIRLVAQTVMDDDEDTGTGGIFETLLARARFTVE